jgi:hypothetical protein
MVTIEKSLLVYHCQCGQSVEVEVTNERLLSDSRG